MFTLYTHRVLVVYLLLGDLIQSFGYSQTLSIFIISTTAATNVTAEAAMPAMSDIVELGSTLLTLVHSPPKFPRSG
jgi:hypothetical protein